jgi:hypothetical protein
MKKKILTAFIVMQILIVTLVNAQCIRPADAIIATTTSTCINNGSVAVHNVTGGSLDSMGINPLKEYSIVTSSNPNQLLIGWQNDSLFNNLYPGTYTVAIRFNCGASGTGYSDSLVKVATVTGSYQSIAVGFSNIMTSFCNNGSFTVNATKGYTSISGNYTYQLVSAQNATQPDPLALTPTQTSNIFTNLTASTYYVRVFDDCGNFITNSVTIPPGTVINPFLSTPYCYRSGGVFGKFQYGCNDSTNYFLYPKNFSFNMTFTGSNMALPGTAVLFYPDGTSDTAIINTIQAPGMAFANKKINSFITTGQYGPFYMKYTDACGNIFNSFKAQYKDTTKSPVQVNIGTAKVCAGTRLYANPGYFTNCSEACTATLITGNTYGILPQLVYNGTYRYSIDNGVTWNNITDTLLVPCSNSNISINPKIANCGDTLTSCYSITIAPCNFKFNAIEVNSFACNGNSGFGIFVNGGTAIQSNGAIKINFSTIPAGQPAIPTLGIFNPDYTGDRFSPGSAAYYNYNYLLNLVPGKYVYTVTDTLCGQTYTDSITLTHPHQYAITNIAVQQTCTNASVNVTTNNNSFYAVNSIWACGRGAPNKYILKLVNSSNTIIQTKSFVFPVTALCSGGTDGSVKTGITTFTNVPVGTYAIKLYLDSSVLYYNPYTSCNDPLMDSVTVATSALNIASSLFINCNGTSGSIAANAIGGVGPYTYELYNGTVLPPNLITTQSSPLFTGLNASQTYSIRVIDNCGTGISVSKSFSPYAAIVRQLGSACLTNNLKLYTDTIAGATYSWTKDGISLNDTTNSYIIPNLSIADYGTYVVTVTIAGCNSFNASRRIDASNCIVLPIQLANFSAIVEGTKVHLRWQTTAEINADYFDVERGTNEIAYAVINRVQAKGIPTGTSYQYIDVDPLRGVNYYRLKIADKDGNYKYSDIRVTRRNGKSGEITLFPNPVHTLFKVVLPEAAPAQTIVQLYNTEGRLVRINSAGNQQIISMNIADLPGGVYYMRIVTAETILYTAKIQKD